MQHRRQQVDARAGSGQLAQAARAGDVRERVVGPRRHQQVHPATAPRREHQRQLQRIVGHEVRRGDAHAAVRAMDRAEEEVVGGVVAAVGPAGQQLRQRTVRVGIDGGDRARRFVAAGGGPVAFEAGHRIDHQPAFDHEAEVAPCGGVRFVEEILGREVAPAAPAGACVHHHQLAVVAQVAAAELRTQAQPQRREPAQPRARIAQHARAAAVAGERTQSVQQHAHRHAALARPPQCLGDARAHRVVAEDEHLDVDAGRRRIEQLQQRLQRLRAFGVQRDATAVPGRRQVQAAGECGGPGGFGIGLHARRVGGDARMRQFARAEQQVDRQCEVGEGDQRDHPRHRRGRRAPLATGMGQRDVEQQADRDRRHVQQGQPVPGLQVRQSQHPRAGMLASDARARFTS